MAADRLQILNESIGARPDWFWEWVELNQQDETLLPDWFQAATAEHLLTFWKCYYDEVLGALIPEYEGFYVEDEGGFHLSEDDMSDFNNWVIVQGKSVWEAMAKEANIREANPKAYDERRLEKMFKIYHESRLAESEGGQMPETEWNGVRWIPRSGYFPGDTADFIYEDRFGITLWEQLDH